MTSALYIPEITIINETDDINIFPINKEKCGIVCGYKNYYICNLIKMEINLKIELNIKEKLFLLKFIDDDNKYKFYLTDETNKKLLYISSYLLIFKLIKNIVVIELNIYK